MADAAGSETGTKPKRIKTEKDADPTAGHSHRFYVKFPPDHKEYTIDCVQPGTVLRAIQTCNQYENRFSDKKRFPDENPVIQMGKKDRKHAIATHFPCICIWKDECLILSHGKEKTEETQVQNEEPIQSEEMYSVFCIETVGGTNTRTKKFIRSKAFSTFKYLCVYGEKGREMTVEDALRRDGRFIDDLGNFTLSDNTDPNKITECTQPVDNLHGKEFKLSLKKAQPEKTQLKSNKKAVTEEVKQRINVILKTMGNNKLSVQDLVDHVRAENRSEGNSGQSGIGVDVEKIYDLLREQCAGLKELMMRRFPGDSYQKALNLRKEDFGKIQQSFSEVYIYRKLIKLGESVCLIVTPFQTGTGFVLFDNFILTNAHLFEKCVEEGNKKLKDGTEVKVYFNFEEEHKNDHYFKLAHRNICYCDDELDYAIFQLDPVGKKDNPETTEVTEKKVPPGLLERFGPMPESGEACLIGHPGGGVKKLDPTSIIEIGNRKKAVEEPYKDTLFTLYSIRDLIKNQGIESILVGGNRAEKGTTYNTFMYHGSSGSPVFDAQCRVFGLHTSGYGYNPEISKSVIEWAQPLLTIFTHFVSKLRVPGNEELLRRVQEVAEGNSDLEKILNPDSDDSMEID